MADHGLPIVTRRDEDGEIIRILIREDWFERLAPILRYFKEISSVVSVEALPSELAQELEKPIELINSLNMKFGVSGWIFSVSLIYVFQWAAAKGITFSKFVYEQVTTDTGCTLGGEYGAHEGGEHGGTLGNIRTTGIKEISE